MQDFVHQQYVWQGISIFFGVVSTFRFGHFQPEKKTEKTISFSQAETLQPPPTNPGNFYHLPVGPQLRGVLFFPWVQNSVGFGMNHQFLGSEKDTDPNWRSLISQDVPMLDWR